MAGEVAQVLYYGGKGGNLNGFANILVWRVTFVRKNRKTKPFSSTLSIAG